MAANYDTEWIPEELTPETVSKPKTISGRVEIQRADREGVQPAVLEAISAAGFRPAPGTVSILIGPPPYGEHLYWAATYLAVKP